MLLPEMPVKTPPPQEPSASKRWQPHWEGLGSPWGPVFPEGRPGQAVPQLNLLTMHLGQGALDPEPLFPHLKYGD
jgi:hypothetical protein